MKEHMTERGIAIQVAPIPLLLDEIRRAHEAKLPPFTVPEKVAGKVVEREIGEEEALAWAAENPDSWAEHAERWQEWKAKELEISAALNDALFRAVLMRAIQVEVPDDGWEDEHRLMGLEVPEKPVERRLHYVKTEVVGGPRDIIQIMAMASSGELDEEALASAEASFRGLLQRAATAEFAAAEGGMVDVDADGAGEGSAGLGQDAE